MRVNKRALLRAIKKAGSQAALAEKLGIRQTAVSNWLVREHLPVEQAIEIERVTGVPRHELRPDLFRRTTAA